MLVLVDALTAIAFSALFKKDEHHLGDYLSVPVIAVCAAAKVGCVIIGCCYGVVLYVNEQGAEVRFPSAAVELAVWILLDIWLYTRERKGNIKGFLYPVAMIGAGFARFALDFMRGSLKERELKILGIPLGAFWSLVLLLLGIVYLNRLFKKKKNRRPTIKESLKIVIGV
jgi:prolipoprotein diacylglyceryltransferase